MTFFTHLLYLQDKLYKKNLIKLIFQVPVVIPTVSNRIELKTDVEVFGQKYWYLQLSRSIWQTLCFQAE